MVIKEVGRVTLSDGVISKVCSVEDNRVDLSRASD